MAIWSAEKKELEKLYESLKGQSPNVEKELERLIKADDENMILLYSRRCLEVIITDLCEYELKRPRKTEPLQGIIDKLNKEEKVPSHIISSMHGLNELSTYGTHPKDFDPEQIKPVLNNLDIILKWYLKYKDIQNIGKQKSEEIKYESKNPELNKEIVHKEASAIKRRDYEISIQESAHISSEKDRVKSVPGKYVLSKRKIVTFLLILLFFGIFGLWGWLKNDSPDNNKLTTYSTIPVESTLMDPYGQSPYFCISPDGQKFYLTRKNVKRLNPPLHLITNWFQELETKTDK